MRETGLPDLGRLEGVLTGIRQLRRVRPLETEQIAGLTVPTLAEMARIKAWLLATRRTTRDYLDTVVRPGDLDAIDLSTYRGLLAPCNDWEYLRDRGRAWAAVLADLLLGRREGDS